MPIYEYKCNACGFQQDVMRKVSDAPLTACPECGQEAFAKMLTAAGIQLKGTGWYATDFKGGKSESKKEETPATPACGAGGCSACS
jgi:putative FmdB family regulatory protein